MEHVTALGELFERVQLEGVFPDGKTFVDCIPRAPISDIRSRYERLKLQPEFSLSGFVSENFDLPASSGTEYQSKAGRPIVEHIELLWQELTRRADESGSSLIPLPKSYVVPGGRFREMFYWDSYFTMLGLAVSGKVELITGMIDNFSFLIDNIGYIPNGNRSYFIGRSQPPFYASMVTLLAEIQPGRGGARDQNILMQYLPQLEKEYAFWMRGADELNRDQTSINRVVLMPDGHILNRYWDESDSPRPESYREDLELAGDVQDKASLFRNLRAACESGWDFSSRWLRDDENFSSIHTTEIIPVDLNCLLYNLEVTIGEAYKASNDLASWKKFASHAEKRKSAVNTYCWDAKKQFYFDYDFCAKKCKDEWTLAAAYPLFFNVAKKEMSAHIANHLKEKFLFPGGMCTTTKSTVQQWDSPNGWAPLQWIVVNGLINYGYDKEAKDIASRWTRLNEQVYNNTGKMMEKYNVISTDLAAGGGEYQSQDGFGWTNGVYLALKKNF